ncbi:hypothetical protein ACT453_58000, partial [Bacillus sp. D-CC]
MSFSACISTLKESVSYKIIDELPENIELALVLHDGSPSTIHHDAELIFRSNHIPWLRGFTSFGEGIIGPYIHPL